MVAVSRFSTINSVPPGEYVPTADQRVVLSNVSWETFELLLAAKGERRRPKVTYLDGALELMSPSTDHEHIKTRLARIVEAYLRHLGILFNGFGAWTVKLQAGEAGLEPDECYLLQPGRKERPDLAIEIVWTSGGLDKLAVYRRLGVPEVWFWRSGTISVHVLTDAGYEARERSAFAPALDFARVYPLLEVDVLSELYDRLDVEFPPKR
jgi:Uma2 family endonuclease